MFKGQPGGGGNSGAVAVTRGMQMVPVSSTGDGDNVLQGVAPSTPLIHSDTDSEGADGCQPFSGG